MTMYGANATQTIGIITDYVNADLTEFLRLVARTYSTYPIENSKVNIPKDLIRLIQVRLRVLRSRLLDQIRIQIRFPFRR